MTSYGASCSHSRSGACGTRTVAEGTRGDKCETLWMWNLQQDLMSECGDISFPCLDWQTPKHSRLSSKVMSCVRVSSPFSSPPLSRMSPPF